MNFVEKHSKLIAVALCLCASGPVLSTVHAYEVQPGWHSNGEVSYYVLDNHQKAKGLTEIEDDTYYFDRNGEMQHGWQNVENKTYYFDNDGKAVTGKSEIQGTTYNFQQTGELAQGWADDGSYNNEKGFRTTSSWVNDEGNKYYFDENGTPVKSTWMDIDGARYYFDENGCVAVGTITVDGQTFYTDDQGIVSSGWVDRGGVMYYYNGDGSLNTESLKDIDGVLYAFNEDGSMMTGGEVNGYLVNADGTAYEKPAEPVVETPVVDTPVVDTPAYDVPVVDTPEYEVPEVEVPAEEPVYQETVVEEPVYETPEEDTYVPEAVVPETVVPTDTYVPEDIEPAPIQPEETYQPVEQAPVVQTTPEPVVSSKADAIYAAAIAQLGRNQDCTMLVTNSLAAVGISFHGWPNEYAALGDWTSSPIPGDIIIYSGHVAIYAGNGMAVHGGWNGNTTVLFSVNCSQALVGYIRVR